MKDIYKILIPPISILTPKQLRSRIPTQPSDVKLTKVETLRLAMSYIMHLEKLVGDIKAQDKESTGSSEVSSTSETKTSRVGVLSLLSNLRFRFRSILTFESKTGLCHSELQLFLSLLVT